MPAAAIPACRKPPSGVGTVWVTGAAGLIGHQLVRQAANVAPGWHVLGLTRDYLDLTDFAAVERRYREAPPDLMFHCAAMSRSPACEADPKAARLNNTAVTTFLGDLAEEIPFFFLSTDLVFDGARGGYREEDPVHPLSVYAESKAEAEAQVRRRPHHTVVRTSLNGGVSLRGDRSFNEQMLLAWREGRALTLFTDEYRSPIAASVTARALWDLALQGVCGTIHLAGAERLSRWEIGQLVAARHPEVMARIQPGRLRDYEGAPRPPDTSLDCSRAAEFLTFPLPGLSEWLRQNREEPF